MDWGKCKTKGSRHGAKAKAGRQGMARQDKAVVAKRAGGEADRHRPCSKQPADDPTGTGLAVKHSRQTKLAGLLPCSRRLVEGVRW